MLSHVVSWPFIRQLLSLIDSLGDIGSGLSLAYLLVRSVRTSRRHRPPSEPHHR